MDLSKVQGLGPSRIKSLEAAGIRTVQALAGLDLRKNVDVPGVSRDALRQHKSDARRLLAAEGKNVPKAPYRKNTGKANGKRTKATPARTPVQAVSQSPDLEHHWQEEQERVAVQATPRRGLLRRLLGRA